MQRLVCRMAVGLCLRGNVSVVGEHQLQGLLGNVGTKVHESVIDIFHIGVVGNGKGFLQDDAAGVDVVVEKEGGHAGLGLAVDDGPVDGCRTPVLRQQRGVDVERAIPRHAPHHLGQHAECHHHLNVGLVSCQLRHKLGVFHLLGLQHRYSFLQGVGLHGWRLQRVLVTAHGFVGLGDDGHHPVSGLYQTAERAHRKLGRAHEYHS